MKMDFKEIGRHFVNWINLALDKGHRHAVANTVLDLTFIGPCIILIVE